MPILILITLTVSALMLIAAGQLQKNDDLEITGTVGLILVIFFGWGATIYAQPTKTIIDKKEYTIVKKDGYANFILDKKPNLFVHSTEYNVVVDPSKTKVFYIKYTNMYGVQNGEEITVDP